MKIDKLKNLKYPKGKQTIAILLVAAITLSSPSFVQAADQKIIRKR